MSFVENSFCKVIQKRLISSGLNHLAHVVIKRLTLLSRFKNKSYAFQKADVSDKGIARLHENVDGLTEGYKLGNSPTHSYDLQGDDYVARHAFQCFAPYTIGGKNYANRYYAWVELYGKGFMGQGWVWDMMELDAYAAQYRFGDNESYVSARVNQYYKAMRIKWKK